MLKHFWIKEYSTVYCSQIISTTEHPSPKGLTPLKYIIRDEKVNCHWLWD